MSSKQTQITKNFEDKKIVVTREFAAPLEQVWKAWTEPELLDQWWAPRPWKTETKSQDFRPGGNWLYAMAGPDGAKHWCRADYKIVDAPHRYTGDDAFCDENGTPNTDFPSMHWDVNFSAAGEDATAVRIEITFDSLADMEKIVEMGFEQGFTMAHGILDELLAK